MIVYLDFDGTCVEHEYPKIGRCNFGCVEIIDKLQKAGHEVILNTMRSNFNDGSLEAALEWFENSWMGSRKNDIDLKPIKATEKKFHPFWNWDIFTKEKIIFIDNFANGIPLKKACMSDSYMVDWDKLDEIFIEKGIY